ncbi:uncharacterized protein B0H18DRAFT_1215350, partial [Fomitopsis serialis]|uniref:uncharacterized protein n=1 Tax=Fomitopsis serialis TaxID=139415 RepID=UPI002008844F
MPLKTALFSAVDIRKMVYRKCTSQAPIREGLMSLVSQLSEAKRPVFVNHDHNRIKFPYESAASEHHITLPDIIASFPGETSIADYWTNISFVVEVKLTKGEDPMSSCTDEHEKTLVQLAKSARNLLVSQSSLFVFVVGIHGTLARIFRFDHGGAVCSRPLDYTTVAAVVSSTTSSAYRSGATCGGCQNTARCRSEPADTREAAKAYRYNTARGYGGRKIKYLAEMADWDAFVRDECAKMRAALKAKYKAKGTLYFVAVEIIGGGVIHEVRHDLESFYWLLVWVVLRHCDHNDNEGSRACDALFDAENDSRRARQKRGWLIEDSPIVHNNKPLSQLLERLRKFCARNDSQHKPFKPFTYRRVLRIFDDTLSKKWPSKDKAIPFVVHKQDEDITLPVGSARHVSTIENSQIRSDALEPVAVHLAGHSGQSRRTGSARPTKRGTVQGSGNHSPTANGSRSRKRSREQRDAWEVNPLPAQPKRTRTN